MAKFLCPVGFWVTLLLSWSEDPPPKSLFCNNKVFSGDVTEVGSETSTLISALVSFGLRQQKIQTASLSKPSGKTRCNCETSENTEQRNQFTRSTNLRSSCQSQMTRSTNKYTRVLSHQSRMQKREASVQMLDLPLTPLKDYTGWMNAHRRTTGAHSPT